MSLGQVESGPTWDGKVLKLQYSSGEVCPDGHRNRTSIIRFKCDKDRVVRETLCMSPISIMMVYPVLIASNNQKHQKAQVCVPSANMEEVGCMTPGGIQRNLV